MAIIKCKMCGGDLNITEGMTVAECEYCGTKQTVPNVDNEKKVTLFSRANRLRISCEFDKASSVYESIVAEFPEEAEAYWGLVLCKYGIEYVDDPATGKKIPTCHRSSFESVMEDSDFEQACENADAVARKVYREEAKAIEEIRKGIIEVSGKEQPYDIFICYKETDENGERTIDSVLAQDIYDALTEKGYRVFFSRITLEDKLGQEYEPYIFAALNSAKIMLAFGTDYEYFNAVWVKNEWSRFLKLMAADKSKHLIPCYKGIDAYDMPKEFAKLQAQDMGKVGATQDLLRGIEKILGRASNRNANMYAGTSGVEASALIQRGNLALEDGDFKSAANFFERALDSNPSDAYAYLGKFFANYGLSSLSDMDNKAYNLDSNNEFKHAEQFADPALAKKLKEVRDSNAVKVQQLRLMDAIRKIAKKKLQAEQKAKREAEERAAEEKRIAEKRAKEEQARKAKEERILYLEEIRNRLKTIAGTVSASDDYTVGLKSDGTVVAAGNNSHGQCNVYTWTDIVAILAGGLHIVGLKSDGTVVAVGENDDGQCDVTDWTDIVAISARGSHTVGLKSDGTVVAAGSNYSGKCDVSDWTDIVAISAGSRHTVGLKSDGTVVAVGENGKGQCDVAGWTDIVAIAAKYLCTVGLKADGTVVAVGENDEGQCDVAGWTDIVAIAAGSGHTVGLKSDGTVATTGRNRSGQCNVSGWKNIVAIAAGYDHTVGLKSDGTVVAVGWKTDGECNVSDWTDIVAISSGGNYIVGLKTDGTVVAVGKNDEGQCDVSKWKLFNSLDTLEDERKEAAKRAEQERQARIQKLQAEKSALNTELSNLKGLFTGKRRKEIEARLAAIGKELKKLV